MRIFFNAQTEANGQIPNPEVEKLKKLAEQSSESIADQAFNNFGNVEIPLGDTSKPPATTIPPASSLLKDIDSLDADIDAATLEGAKSPESLRSFDGLKARYKNKTKAIRDQLQSYQTQLTALTTQLNDLPNLQEKATNYDKVAPTVTQLEQQVKDLRTENESLSYYRRKYDLDKDPTIQEEILAPMEDTKEKAMDILLNSNAGEDVWEQLISSDSEHKVNSLIDQHRITNLNAQSLKRYVDKYKSYKDQYIQISSPEFIESSIDTAKGTRLKNIETASEKIFGSTQTMFKDYVKEIDESEFNKEHNLYVHDKVLESAKKMYTGMLKNLAPEVVSSPLLSMVAKSSILAAAYPMQKQMLSKALEIIADLKTEIVESDTTIRQTKERVPASSNAMADMQKTAAKTTDDIATEIFSKAFGS